MTPVANFSTNFNELVNFTFGEKFTNFITAANERGNYAQKQGYEPIERLMQRNRVKADISVHFNLING